MAESAYPAPVLRMISGTFLSYFLFPIHFPSPDSFFFLSLFPKDTTEDSLSERLFSLLLNQWRWCTCCILEIPSLRVRSRRHLGNYA